MKPKALYLLLFPTLLAFGLLASEKTSAGKAHEVNSTKAFAELFAADSAWPLFVTPKSDIQVGRESQTDLKKGIRTVFIRAYADGMIAVMDRGGSIIIEHNKTDFAERVSETLHERAALPHEKEVSGNIAAQIARRAFNRSFSETRAVSEAFINEFERIIVVRMPSDAGEFDRSLEEMEEQAEFLKSKNTLILVAFEELVDREAFASFFETSPEYLALMSPVYGIGLIETLFTERENEDKVLLIRPSGKLVDNGADLREMLKQL